MPASPMVAAWQLAEVLEFEMLDDGESLDPDVISTVRQADRDIQKEDGRPATPAEAVFAIEARYGAESPEAAQARVLVFRGYDSDWFETVSGTHENPYAHRVRKTEPKPDMSRPPGGTRPAGSF